MASKSEQSSVSGNPEKIAQPTGAASNQRYILPNTEHNTEHRHPNAENNTENRLPNADHQEQLENSAKSSEMTTATMTEDDVFDLDIEVMADSDELTEDKLLAEQILSDSRVEVNVVTSSSPVTSQRSDKGAGPRKSGGRAKKQTCIIKLDGCHYTIVANNMEDNSSSSNSPSRTSYTVNNGQINDMKANKVLARAGSLTILRRSTEGISNGQGRGSLGDIQLVGPHGTKIRAVRSEDISEGHEIEMVRVIPRSNEDLSTIENLPAADSTEALRICSLRLRELLERLKESDVKKEDVIVNLEYAAKVSENIYIVEMSKLVGDVGPDDDDILGVVEPDGVPREVRDWLTMTFTRSPGSLGGKRAADDKLRFRSVAHAIRAGIVVDRIYRRTTSLTGQDSPTEVQLLLKTLDDWSFDVFTLNEKGECHALRDVGMELLRRYDLISKLKISRIHMEGFLLKLEAGYSRYSNPYHNLLHAADVTQTASYVINQSGLTIWLTDLEILAILISAMIHDYEHTGTTNTFHINTNSALALLYNDRAVLENYHVSAAFRLIREDEQLNILSGLKPDEYREFRALVIELVLATDMSSHFQQIKSMKSLLAVPDNIEKCQVLSLIVHCCDISHPAKQWNLHHKWTQLLLEEFFRQGDREKLLNLPISPLCDRNNTLVAESQIGFINFIVDPSFNVMSDSIDALMTSLQRQVTMMKEAETTAKVECESALAEKTELGKEQQNGSGAKLKESWSLCLNDNLNKWKLKAAQVTQTQEKENGV